MVLVTGSSGLVGASIVATLRERFVTRGLDLTAAPTTEVIGDLRDRDVRRRALSGAWAVVHAAALHAPHVGVADDTDFWDIRSAERAGAPPGTRPRR